MKKAADYALLVLDKQFLCKETNDIYKFGIEKRYANERKYSLEIIKAPTIFQKESIPLYTMHNFLDEADKVFLSIDGIKYEVLPSLSEEYQNVLVIHYLDKTLNLQLQV